MEGSFSSNGGAEGMKICKKVEPFDKGGGQEVRRKWEELNPDCLAMVFQRVGLESLIFDVPLVCKPWYKASLDPQSWRNLHFPELNTDNPEEMGTTIFPVNQGLPYSRFTRRFIDEFSISKDVFSFTDLIRFVIDRSCKAAVKLVLPRTCSFRALHYVAHGCPALKILDLSAVLPYDHVPELVCKLKDLEHLILGLNPLYFRKILTQISLNCRNFVGLGFGGYISKRCASSIVTLVPQIKYLMLKHAIIRRENLKIILEGCKELELLDLRGYFDFEADDEVLKMASHIKTFIFEAENYDGGAKFMIFFH
ncbi:hypothetical protein NE237_019091 [Protea cynaroides]|uniref:F-box/LRR-repeat protein n=1 Tax=Protea cynaroides TaxID=273540 RepID=A0A9Q0QPL6_9MAGN|nr:hypothetical protein NE237_019091 [Protea cynaroides]